MFYNVDLLHYVDVKHLSLYIDITFDQGPEKDREFFLIGL